MSSYLLDTTLAIGCLLAIVSSRLPKIPGWAALIMLLAVVLIPSFAAITRMRTLVEVFVLSPILHCAIAGLVLHVIQSPYRILNLAPVVWLGRISYSFYLWQEPFFFAQSRQPARLHAACCCWGRLPFLLPGRTARTAIARQENNRSGRLEIRQSKSMTVLRRFNGCGADRKAVWAGSSELGFTRVQRTKSLLADLSELSLVKTAGSFLQMTGHWH